MLSLLPIAAVGVSRLPGPADRYVPSLIARNVVLITADATVQLALGTMLIILAVTLGAHLVPDGTIGRLALIAGIIGGVGFTAAGAITQEAVFNSVFVGGANASKTATAAGLSDLTAVNLAAGQVAGGMRSAGSYSFGLAWFALAVVGMRTPASGSHRHDRRSCLCSYQMDRPHRGSVCLRRLTLLAGRTGLRPVQARQAT